MTIRGPTTPMQIRILHRTAYRYEPSGGRLVQRLRLTPSSFPGQQVIDWRIDAPNMANAASYLDGNGNLTHLIAHTLNSSGVVLEVSGLIEREPIDGPWQSGETAMPLAAYLRQTPLTQPNAPILAMAKAAGGSGLEQAFALMHTVRGAVDYRIGVTHAHSTAADAARDGEGVCQDHAHIFISAARHLGVPARYVTGYMVTAPGEPAEASHAWAEAFIKGWGWAAFDVANDMLPDENYVRVACGLDARDAAPVAGIRQGTTAAEDLDVLVLVEMVAEQ